MFKLSYTTEHLEDIETLKLKRNPLYFGLGYYEDINGVTYDVHCVNGSSRSNSGKPYINARPVDNSPYYSTDLDSHQDGFHEWKPYYFEVIKK